MPAPDRPIPIDTVWTRKAPYAGSPFYSVSSINYFGSPILSFDDTPWVATDPTKFRTLKSSFPLNDYESAGGPVGFNYRTITRIPSTGRIILRHGGDATKIITSLDGVSWTAATTDSGSSAGMVEYILSSSTTAYRSRNMYADQPLPTTGPITKSTNGVTWTDTGFVIPKPFGIRNGTSVENDIVAMTMCQNTLVVFSWSAKYNPYPMNPDVKLYLSTYDGTSWTYRSPFVDIDNNPGNVPAPSFLAWTPFLAVGPTLYLFEGGPGGTYVRSTTDFTNFSSVVGTVNTSHPPQRVSLNSDTYNRKFATDGVKIVGQNLITGGFPLVYSTDAVNWAEGSGPANANLANFDEISHYGGTWHAWFENERLISSDGITWTYSNYFAPNIAV